MLRLTSRLLLPLLGATVDSDLPLSEGRVVRGLAGAELKLLFPLQARECRRTRDEGPPQVLQMRCWKVPIDSEAMAQTGGLLRTSHVTIAGLGNVNRRVARGGH